MGLINWLATIGSLLVAAAVGIWGYTEVNRTATIWLIGFPGGLFLLVALGLEFQKGAVPKAQESGNEIQRQVERPYLNVQFSPVVLGGATQKGDVIPPQVQSALGPIKFGGGFLQVGRQSLIVFGAKIPGAGAETVDFNFEGIIGNYGRLPAVIKDGSMWIYVDGPALPTIPLYAEPSHDGLDWIRTLPPGPYPNGAFGDSILIPQQGVPFIVDFHLFQRHGDPMEDALNNNISIRGQLFTDQLFLFVYGVVRYQDQLKRNWEFGFARRYNAHDNHLEETGGDKYNFDRQAQSHQR